MIQHRMTWLSEQVRYDSVAATALVCRLRQPDDCIFHVTCNVDHAVSSR